MKYVVQEQQVIWQTYFLDNVPGEHGVGVCDQCGASSEEVKKVQTAVPGFKRKNSWANYDKLTDEPTRSQSVTEGVPRPDKSRDARPSVYWIGVRI